VTLLTEFLSERGERHQAQIQQMASWLDTAVRNSRFCFVASTSQLRPRR